LEPSSTNLVIPSLRLGAHLPARASEGAKPQGRGRARRLTLPVTVASLRLPEASLQPRRGSLESPEVGLGWRTPTRMKSDLAQIGLAYLADSVLLIVL
jgi:hypothetical protein